MQPRILILLVLLLARCATAQIQSHTYGDMAWLLTRNPGSAFSPSPDYTNYASADYPLNDGGTTAKDYGPYGVNATVNYIANSLSSVDFWGLGITWPESLWIPESAALSDSPQLLIADGPQFSFGLGNFAISVWLATTSTTYAGAGNAELVAVGNCNSSVSGDYYFLGINGSNATFNVDGTSVNGTNSMNDGGFHHLVVNKAGGEIYLWCDGVLQASNAYAGAASPSGGKFSIGSFGAYAPGGGAYQWWGNIADLLVYTNSLTTAQITQNYNARWYNNFANQPLQAYYYQPRQATNTGRLAWYFHGATQDQNAANMGYGFQAVSWGLLTNGYALGAANNDTQNWGNSNAISSYSNAVVWAKSAQAATTLYALPASMGGLAGLTTGTNLGFTYAYCFCPVFCLSNMCFHPGTGANYSNNIVTAYGISPISQYPTATAGYDPFFDATNRWNGLNIRATGSTSDTYVPVATCGGGALTNAIHWATLFPTSGDHFDQSNFNLADVLSFF